MSTAVAGKGLEGIVAANSGICWIDGEAGVLSYRGIDIHELAEHSTFEETTYLLWNGILPNQLALREFHVATGPGPRRSTSASSTCCAAFPPSATPMEVLRTAVSALSFYDADEKDNSHDANVRKAYNLTAQIAMIVAIYDRHAQGQGNCSARPLALPRRQLSVDAERREALGDRHPNPRHRPDPARRPRAERLHLRRPRHRRHPLRHSLRHHRRHRRAQGPAARRRQRRRDAPAAHHRQGRRRSGGVREEHAGRQAEDLRLRPSRLQDRRPARHAPAQDERAARQGLRASPSGTRCRAPSSSTSTRTRS